jgi:hypothetical protein
MVTREFLQHDPPVLFTVSLCSRRLNFRRCRTSTLGAWLARAEVPLAHVGNVPLFRPSGLCFRDGRLIGCGRGGLGVARGLTHAGLGGSSFRLSVLFLCFFSVYSCFLSQFIIVVG